MKKSLIVSLDIVWLVLYFGIGYLTDLLNLFTANAVFIIVFAVADIALAYVKFASSNKILLILQVIKDLIIAVPHVYFLIDLSLDGVITTFLQGVTAFENANVYIITNIVVLVVNSVILVLSLKKKGEVKEVIKVQDVEKQVTKRKIRIIKLILFDIIVAIVDIVSYRLLWLLPITDKYSLTTLPIYRDSCDIILILYIMIIASIVIALIFNVYYGYLIVKKKKTSKFAILSLVITFIVISIASAIVVESNYHTDYFSSDDTMKPSGDDAEFYPYFDTLLELTDESDCVPLFEKTEYELFGTKYLCFGEENLFFTDEYYEENNLDGEITCEDSITYFTSSNDLFMDIVTSQFAKDNHSLSHKDGTYDNVKYGVYYDEDTMCVYVNQEDSLFAFEIENHDYYGVTSDDVVSKVIEIYKSL